MKSNELFFYKNAGYGWNPSTQTQEEGRIACAKALAQAELDGKAAGLYFTWEIDEYADDSPAYICCCRSAHFATLSCLGGIDLGKDENPFGSRPAYCRVVEAKLAAEALDACGAEMRSINSDLSNRS